MWNVDGETIQMAEGDYGIKLPITISGADIDENDSIRLTFKTTKNGETVLVKEATDIVENTVDLELTEEESAEFPVGTYAYSLDWYHNGSFLCNIIPSGKFKVVDKA